MSEPPPAPDACVSHNSPAAEPTLAGRVAALADRYEEWFNSTSDGYWFARARELRSLLDGLEALTWHPPHLISNPDGTTTKCAPTRRVHVRVREIDALLNQAWPGDSA